MKKSLFIAAALLAASTTTVLTVANAKTATPKVITTKDGLKYQDLRVGTGDIAKAGEGVEVNYKGTLLDGTIFDQSYGRGPFDFNLGAGQVIKGWDEGVAGMKVGGKRKLIVPADLAYGDQSPSPTIPPNSTLVFIVELLKVGPAS